MSTRHVVAAVAMLTAGGVLFSCSDGGETKKAETIHEPTLVEVCADGADNDEDGDTDCADSDCAMEAACLCGDGTCDATIGEDVSCPVDCPVSCGDGMCDAMTEDNTTCPQDCSQACGDGICGMDEDVMSCPLDCSDQCFPFDAPLGGVSAICDVCTRGACPCELEDCQKNANCDPYRTCALTTCASSCTYDICDAMNPQEFGSQACATCMGNSCCQPYKDCELDMNCWDCWTGVNPDVMGCQAMYPEFDTLVTCFQDNCAGFCP